MDFDIIEELSEQEILDLYELENEKKAQCYCRSYVRPAGCRYNDSTAVFCTIDNGDWSSKHDNCVSEGSALGLSPCFGDGYQGQHWLYNYGSCAGNLSNYCSLYGRRCSADGSYCDCSTASCR